MRKILSFVAAMFVALAVNAQELPSTDFAAPGYSCAADAAVLSGTATELSGKFYLDETASPHHIAWSDLSKQYTAVATWHFHASRACYVTVTLDLGPVIASNKHIFDVELHAANGDRLDTIAEGPNYTGDGFTEANVQKTLEGQILIPAAGDYYIELRNNRDWCKGSIKNVILTYAADAPVIGAPAYYLVGTMNNWTPADEYKFEENPGAPGEYMLTAALTVGDEIKVKGIVGATETWYPAGTGNNYVVDADHAGEWKKIYFRPEGQGGEDWHYGFFLEENPAPVVEFDTIYTWYGKRGESTATEAIEKGGVATAEGGNSNIVVGTAQKTNWTIKLNKGFSNANYVGISLNEALKAGDQMQLAAFIASDNTAVLGIDFSESKEAASTDCQLLFSNLQLISTNAAPEDTLFTIPAAAAGAKYIRVYRNSGQTGVYIANITILRNTDTPEPPAPQPQGCDWNNIEFLGSTDAQYTNQFKVCVASELDPQVVNIQQGFGDEIGIYCQGFANADFQSISVPEGKYSVQGAGIIFHISYFTAKETEVEVICGGGGHFVYQFTVLNVNGTEPQPEVNYSLKNNWDAAADWTWKEMTKDGDNYKLENVVFGGTGVNYNTAESDEGATWVPMADFLGDKVDAKDTVTDSTITATLIGKYIEPAPEPVYSLWKVVSTTDTTHAVKYIDNEYLEVKTVYQGTVIEQNAVIFDETFTHAIQVRTDQYPSTEDVVGPVKAGSTPLVFTAKQDASIAIYYLRQAVNKAWTDNDNKDVILFDQAAPTVKIAAAKMEADSVLADSSYYFMAKSYNLQAGHTYTLTAKGTTIKLFGISYPAVPEPVHTYTVAGAPATLFGQEWAPSYAANDLEPIVGGEYTHGWKKDSVALAAGKVEFKIVEDHAWDVAYPAQNYELPIAENAIYNIAIFFNDQTKAVYAEATKVGDLPLPEGITCDSVYNLAKNDTAALAPVVVTYVNGKNVYVMDATAGMLLYLPANGTWKIGDQLTGVEGVVDIYNGIYEVKLNAAQVAAVTADSGAVPQPVKVDSVTMKDMSKFILVEGIEFDTDTAFVEGKQANITIVVAGDSIVLRNNFKNGYEFKAGKKYNISALVTLYYGKLQLYFVTAEEQATIAYYVAGSMNGWAANEAYMLTPNNESLYEGEFTFAANDEFKVIGFNGKTTTWFPEGMGNNFKITEAGDYKITFNPAGNVEGWYAGYFNVVMKEAPIDTIPTTAPAAPTAAEDDVMAIYCNHYATNNLHFEILGWGGVTTWHADTIDGVAIVHCQDMKYEFLTNWGAASYDMSAYKKLHADLWAPAASTIRLGIEALGVNDGGSGFKNGVVCTLAEGWNSIDIEFSSARLG